MSQENVQFYAEMLGTTSTIDAVAYRKEYGRLSRNADGIPLAAEDQVEKFARAVAVVYERRYDETKSILISRGLASSGMLPDDEGVLMKANFAAITAAPVVSELTDHPQVMPYSIGALHWLLARPGHQWVFDHLTEAVGAYDRCGAVRENVVPDMEDEFDDLRSMLREALRHYIHRHV